MASLGFPEARALLDAHLLYNDCTVCGPDAQCPTPEVVCKEERCEVVAP